MLKLKRFLKPFAGAVLLAIVLLFIQAICDLNLPNLMSDIVNVGIQQGGIEEAAPTAFSSDAYTFTTSFMSDAQKQVVEDSYTQVTGSDTDSKGKPYSDTYPESANMTIYVMNSDVDAATRAQLDDIFGTTTWTMLNFFRHLQSASDDGSLQGVIEDQIHTQAVAAIVQQLRDSGQPLPPGVDLDYMAEQIYQQQLAANGGQLPGTDSTDMPNLDISGLGSSDSGSSDSTSTDIQSLDLSKIYQLQPVLALLPSNWFSDARDQAATIDPAMRTQSATMLTAAFYQELGTNMSSIEIAYIVRIGLLMLLVTVISGIATVCVGFISTRVGAGVARNLRSSIFSKVSSFSHTELNRFSTASLITRTTNDVTVMQMFLSLGIRMICYAPIMGVGAVIMALSKSVSMSWIIALAVVVMICISIILMVTVLPKFRLLQKLIDRLNLVARETLTGMMVIRAFSRDQQEQERFAVANTNLMRTNLFVNRAMVFMMPIIMLLMNGLTILIIWVGAHQVAASTMQVGDMMAFMQYVMQVLMSFMFIAMMFVFIPRAQVSAGRISEVLDTVPTIVDPVEPKHIDAAQRGHIRFNDVSFQFEGAETEALWRINLDIQPGQTVAFIGPTGSGKSSILNLIPRFYDVTSGSVEVSGVDVRELAQSELRRSIGYVPQQSQLMTGTIETNMAYGVPDEYLPPEDLERIAAVSQAKEFISEQEDGFDTEISQGGTNVSGGQRQRLAIARALAIKPDIYLFDDSFSALDFKTDAALRKALPGYTEGATILIVAQRVGTIMDADRIYVIEDGCVVGQGTHAELIKSCPTYQEIASSQLTELDLGGEE